MSRRKEIFIIIVILTITLVLAFLPMMTSINKNNDVIEEEKKPTTLKISISGEIKEDKIEIKIPYGYTYGYIISKIELYLNEYSIIDDNKNKRYYEDTSIIILSSDNKNDIDIDVVDKININNASLDDLVKLYGIGEKRANAIIEYRNNKKIESFTELKELIGVSDEIIRNIKEKAIL